MHSGSQIPEMEHHIIAPENSCTALLLSMNQTHNILDQTHGALPTTQQLFLGQPFFLPPHHHHQTRLNHQSFFPVNFKLGLNEICTSNENNDGTVNCINEGEDALLRGSEQNEVPEARHSSLGMTHCWQNQADSAIKQQPFWEPLPAEISNENSDIVDRQLKHIELNQKEALTNCLESKSRVVHFGELEEIYNCLGTAESNQTAPSEILPVNPLGFDHGYSGASIGEEASTSMKNAKRKRRKKRNGTSYNQLINPMAQFFEGLVKQMLDNQENLEKKFAEVIERFDEERREREEAWKNQELAHFEQETEARAREKASAASREATMVSYLEKITGQRLRFSPFNLTEITSTNATDDLQDTMEQEMTEN